MSYLSPTPNTGAPRSIFPPGGSSYWMVIVVMGLAVNPLWYGDAAVVCCVRKMCNGCHSHVSLQDLTLILSHKRLFRRPVMARVYARLQAMRLYMIFEVLHRILIANKESHLSIQHISFIKE